MAPVSVAWRARASRRRPAGAGSGWRRARAARARAAPRRGRPPARWPAGCSRGARRFPDDGAVALAQGEVAPRGAGALDEQLDRGVLAQRADVHRALAGVRQHQATGHQEAGPRRHREPAGQRLARGVRALLDVVEHPKRPRLLAQRAPQTVQARRRGEPGLQRDLQALGDRRDQGVEVADLAEIEEPGAAIGRDPSRARRGEVQREPGLADARRAQQRDQAGAVGAHAVQLLELLLAAHEGAALGRQVAPLGGLRGGRREDALGQRGRQELDQVLVGVEAAQAVGPEVLVQDVGISLDPRPRRGPGGVADQDLAAVSGAADRLAAGRGGAAVAHAARGRIALHQRLAQVHAHAHAQSALAAADGGLGSLQQGLGPGG